MIGSPDPEVSDPEVSVPAVSVIVCTHNRADSLRRTLPTVLGQELTSTAWEVVVVDNGSTDRTRAVVEALNAEAPHLRYVHEPELGLSAARNRGLAEARGTSVVVFTDDDVLAPKTWLAALLAGFDRFPDAAAVGGRIELRLPGPRPKWLPLEFDGFLARFDLGDDPRWMDASTFPVGANMAFRKEWADLVGDFKTTLGRRGAGLGASEEEEFFERLRGAGGKVAYVPDATVDHIVLAERTRRRWFVRRGFAQGRSSVVLLRERRPRSRAEMLARAAAAVAKAIAGPRSLLVGVVRRDRPWFASAVSSATWLGCAIEAFGAAVARKPDEERR